MRITHVLQPAFIAYPSEKQQYPDQLHLYYGSYTIATIGPTSLPSINSACLSFSSDLIPNGHVAPFPTSFSKTAT